MRSLAVVLACLLSFGCHAGPGPRPPRAPLVDTPYELADELDFAERADDLAAMPAGPARTALRADLARALGPRVDRALTAGRLERASAALTVLVGLWAGDAAALGELAELPGWAARLDRARAAFARGGAGRDAALVLAVRAVVRPDLAARDRDELEQILRFDDDLVVARLGPLGRGTGAAAVLGPLLERGLVPDLLDRYLALVIERANRADQAVTSGQATPAAAPVVRAALGASRDLAIALAVAGHPERLGARLAEVHGLGRERAFTSAAAAVADPDAPAAAWLALAKVIRASDGGDPEAKRRAAAALARHALVRFPDDVEVLAAAATAAVELEQVATPIALLERARRLAPADPALVAPLLGLYRERLGRLVYAGRLRAARACLAGASALYGSLAREFPAQTWSPSWPELLATFGRGLVSQGELAEGQRVLAESVAAGPTIEALEMLGTVALKTGRPRVAQREFERAVALPGDRPAQLYARAKLLRLAGDAALAAADRGVAIDHFAAALALWADLGERVDLPPNLAGERLVESGKLFWALGKDDDGNELLATASDADPGGADTHMQSVAFLLLHEQYDRARDNFYQALASDAIGDYYKVYMALWILAEGRRQGRPDDDQARAFLAGRDGPLWYDDIARLASGRAVADELAPRAASRARQTELAYYTAVLGGAAPAQAQALLEDVVDSDMVLFFEYDMAKHWLGRGR